VFKNYEFITIPNINDNCQVASFLTFREQGKKNCAWGSAASDESPQLNFFLRMANIPSVAEN
jgi:hypothetical protein